MNKLSIVVPACDEAECLGKLVYAINALNLNRPLEFVLVDDGSGDATLSVMREMAAKDDRVRYLSFSRHFGKEAAILAGIRKSSGELVVTMDADMQHDPALLKEMLKAIEEEGYDSAAACRTRREGEPRFRGWFSRSFFTTMNLCSEIQLKYGAMDYRMMTRRFVNEVLALNEVDRFTKGIYEWVGFKTKWIEVETPKRVAGATKWKAMALFTYSVRSFVAFSTAPLKFASVLGAACCLGSFLYMAYVFLSWLLFGNPVSGWPTIVCAIFFFGGLQLFVIGLVGIYVASVAREAKKRPHYVIGEER